MVERISPKTESYPRLERWGNVNHLKWNLDGEPVELLFALTHNRHAKAEAVSLISRLNGSHPTVEGELADSYYMISASASIEAYKYPQPSDSEDSDMFYLARERDKPRRIFIQEARKDSLASIHEHEQGADIWERYDWVRGNLGLVLPDSQKLAINETSRQVVIPGALKHQAKGESESSSISIITTTAKEHIYSTSF